MAIALALFVSYAEAVDLKNIDLLDSRVIIGLFIGAVSRLPMAQEPP